MKIVNYLNAIRVKIREATNPYLGKYRSRKLNRKDVTIISNNCWGGHVYRYLGMSYLSPTIGLYFYADDYIKFCSNIEYYLNKDLRFIPIEESKNSTELISSKKTCPIGVIDDIEIVFLHYASEEEAYEKWNRRKERIVWDNIVYKMSEQNACTVENIRQFSKLPVDRKFCYVTNDYGNDSDVLWSGGSIGNNVLNDTFLFGENVDPIRFINGDSDYKRKQKKAARKLGINSK